MGWFLLAYIIQRCSCLCPQVFGQSKMCRQKSEFSKPIEACCMEEPFQQWGLDIIRDIFPQSLKQHRYILTSIDYFTWWTKEVSLKQVNDQEVIKFLQHNIISRFEVPTLLVFDNETYFSSLILYDFSLENGIILKHSDNYYPLGNGLAELTNKNLIRIIKRPYSLNNKTDTLILVNTLWAG